MQKQKQRLGYLTSRKYLWFPKNWNIKRQILNKEWINKYKPFFHYQYAKKRQCPNISATVRNDSNRPSIFRENNSCTFLTHCLESCYQQHFPRHFRWCPPFLWLLYFWGTMHFSWLLLEASMKLAKPSQWFHFAHFLNIIPPNVE